MNKQTYTTAALAIIGSSIVLAAFSLSYNAHSPKEPLETAPKNIQWGIQQSAAPYQVEKGLSHFRINKGSHSLYFKKEDEKQFRYLKCGCSYDCKYLPHYWRQSRKTVLELSPDGTTVFAVNNLDQNINYHFSTDTCKK